MFSETFVLCREFLLFSFFFFFLVLDWFFIGIGRGGVEEKTISESLEFLLTSVWKSFC